VLHIVVEDDAVLVVDQLGFVAELHRFAQAPFRDRAGVRVVQTDPPGRAIRCLSGQPVPGLSRNRACGGEQFGQVMNSAGQPTPAAASNRVRLA